MEGTSSEPGGGTSPYAAGGGGVVFEHVFAATLLAALIGDSPVALLGDEVHVDSVAFQAEHVTPVDDVLVTGTVAGPHPSQRQLMIAVRRRPALAPSDDDFVALVADMLAVLETRWEEVVAGTLRLGLVVAEPSAAIEDATALTELAREHLSAESFHAAERSRSLARIGRTTSEDVPVASSGAAAISDLVAPASRGAPVLRRQPR